MALPLPQLPMTVRVATLADLPALDALQKQNSKALGYFPTAQFEEYIERGNVLVAEEAAGLPFGYILSRDRYLKRDELGVIYQLCVAAGRQRSLVGASLVKGAFERSAYGCRLYCCWCAQDLAANRFWESLGFVPIAFRGGSAARSRVHIFWQRRIRDGDVTTPYWFPAKTDSGAMREDRLVLPIPPGMHWSEQMPVLKVEGTKALSGDGTKGKRVPGTKCGPQTPTASARARVQFAGPPAANAAIPPEPQKPQASPARTRVAKEKARCDPKLIAAARELRDRWMEHVDSGGMQIEGSGKYEVARAISERPATRIEPSRPVGLLPAA